MHLIPVVLNAKLPDSMINVKRMHQFAENSNDFHQSE